MVLSGGVTLPAFKQGQASGKPQNENPKQNMEILFLDSSLRLCS